MEDTAIKKIYLADLKHGPVRDNICVRIMRKWIYDGTSQGINVRYVGLVLADEKGDFIYADIPSDHMKKKKDIVELDKVYLIRKFNVKASRQTYVPFIKQYMVQFSAFTEAMVVREPPPGFPDYVYKLTPYSELNPVPPHNTVYADVLGIIVSIGDIQEQHIASKQTNVTMREIIIKDLRNNDLKVTLWADHATNFMVPGASSPETAQSIVVLFVGCVPKSINRKTQLNGGYGCRWFFNPNIKEAQPYYQSLRNNPVPVYQIQDKSSDIMPLTPPVILKHINLADIIFKDPYDLDRQGYKCTITVTDVPQDKKYWYMGCAACKSAQKECTSEFSCSKCKCTTEKPFYRLTFVGKDDTAEAKFFAYDVPARNVVHRDVKAVLNQAAREAGFPKFLTQIISNKYTLHIVLGDDSYDTVDLKTFHVRAVIADHAMEAYIAKQQHQNLPSGSSLVPASSDLPTTQAVQQVDMTEPSTAALQMTATPASEIIIQPLALQQLSTPPPVLDHMESPIVEASATTSTLDDPAGHLKSISKQKGEDKDKTVRRELFPEDGAENQVFEREPGSQPYLQEVPAQEVETNANIAGHNDGAAQDAASSDQAAHQNVRKRRNSTETGQKTKKTKSDDCGVPR